MQHGQMGRSVLGVGLLLAFHIHFLSATTLEDLLSAQETHEASAHADFVSWCHGAQSTLTDRVTSRKEHIEELTGAIESYSAKIDQLRNSTKKNMQPLGALSQEQRLQLIQTESEHWRSVHAKDAAERLLEAHRDLLEGVEGALQWEQQALDHHHAARQQLIALVHEHQLQQSIEPRPMVEAPAIAAPAIAAPAVVAPAVVAPAVTVPVAAPLLSAPEVFMNFLPATPPLLGVSRLPPLELTQAFDLKVPLPAESTPGLTPARASPPVLPPAAAAATQSPLAQAPKPLALNPLLSLASMSSGSTAQVIALPAAAADPMPGGLVAAVQAWFKPAKPATATVVKAAPAVLPVVQAALAVMPVAATAAPVVATVVQTAPAVVPVIQAKPIVAPVVPTAAPVVPTVVLAAPTVVPVSQAAPAVVPVAPTAAPVVTTVVQAAPAVVPVAATAAPAVATVVQTAPAVMVVVQPAPAVVTVAPTAAPVVQAAPTVVPVAPTAAPVVATVVQAAVVKIAPTAAPVVAAVFQAAPAVMAAIPAAPDVVPVVQKGLPVPTPAKSLAKKATNEDPEEALMAIMTGSTADAGSLETEAKATAPAPPATVPMAPPPSAPVHKPVTKPPTAFLQKTVAAPSPPAPQDPEDALMEVMMQKAITEDPVVAATSPLTSVLALVAQTAPTVQQVRASPATVHTAPAVKQVQAAPATVQTAPVVQQVRAAPQTVPTAPAVQQVRAAPATVQIAPAVQQVRATPATVQSASKPEVPQLKNQAAPKKQPAPDSEAGVMQSFVQDVADLGQGEPGQSQVDPAAPALKEQQEEETQESQAHMMSSFVQEVSRLAQGEPSSPEAQVTSSPTTATGLTLSSDLASLMGLSSQTQPASFLQIARGGRRMRRALSRSELAAASLIRDLDSSEISKRLGRTVSQSSVESNVQMLTALNEELQAREFHWACIKGPVAAHSMAVLQLAETGTSLLVAERDTVASLSAELRDTQAASAQLKAEFITRLEQTFGQGYEAARADLDSLPLAQIRSESPVGASTIAALEDSLRADAAAARQLAAKWVDRGSEYVRLGDDLLQASSGRDSELQKASSVLSAARARAATTRGEAAKEPGCSNAVRTSGLIAAVYKALHILSD